MLLQNKFRIVKEKRELFELALLLSLKLFAKHTKRLPASQIEAILEVILKERKRMRIEVILNPLDSNTS